MANKNNSNNKKTWLLLTNWEEGAHNNYSIQFYLRSMESQQLPRNTLYYKVKAIQYNTENHNSQVTFGDSGKKKLPF